MRVNAKLALTLMLTLVALGGCSITGPTFCFHAEPGDCDGGGGVGGDKPAAIIRVVGLPAERVDSLGQGLLRVGETVTVKVVPLGQSWADTSHYSHTTTWAVDVASARITRDENGVGQLTAMAPGSVDQIVADGRAFPLWLCSPSMCSPLARIVILP
jgi:hypothetical protein